MYQVKRVSIYETQKSGHRCVSLREEVVSLPLFFARNFRLKVPDTLLNTQSYPSDFSHFKLKIILSN
ncbi:hypothetical protein D3C87_309250 [compost metagenome]